MPELPEVETTRRGIEPHVLACRIERVIVREARLRRHIPAALAEKAAGRAVRAVTRRGKYLLLDCGNGHIIIHLGMSGSLRIVPADTPAAKHEHVDIVLNSGKLLRYRDPRRFGLVLWTEDPPLQHALLANLGPEPLNDGFTGAHLYQCARNRKSAVKMFLMDSHIVVGVGNIYANESLFAAGIHPARAAGRIAAARYESLARAVRGVLSQAIAQGGTTLRDFTNSEGKPGYFQQTLQVYGRAGQACQQCGETIQRQVLGQRATYYCAACQH